MAVSIRDVAKAAGVSAGTVTRALNHYPDVSTATRDRIIGIARQMGYRPNQMARSLSSKHNNNIGLVFSGFLEEKIINSFVEMLMRGSYQYAMSHGVELSICMINTRIQQEKSFEQLCHEHNIAGAVLMGLKTTDPYCQSLAQSQLPCVTVDIEVDGPCVSCVLTDDVKAFDELTQYLIDRGHRRIALVHGRKNSMVSVRRLEGARQAMARSGLRLREEDIIYTNFLREEATEGVQDYLRAHGADGASAFLCMSDLLAVGAIEGLKKLHYRVPQDYSVVGFDGLDFTNYTDPTITTIDQNIQQKGYEAARLLCEMIADKQTAQRLVLPHTLAARQSVRTLTDKADEAPEITRKS